MRNGVALLAAICTMTGCTAPHPPQTPPSAARAACDAAVAQHDQAAGVYESPPTGSNVTLRPGQAEPMILVANSSFGGWGAPVVGNSVVAELRQVTGTYPRDCKVTAMIVALSPGTTSVSAGTYVPPGSERPSWGWTITVTVRT